MLITSRRSFLAGLVSALAAPAIVHATNIMPVRNVVILPTPGFDSFDNLMPDGMQYQWVSKHEHYAYDAIHRIYNFEWSDWRPVPASRHKGRFGIGGDVIEVGGSILVERPKIAVAAARQQEVNRAHNLVADWMSRAAANGFEGRVRVPVGFTEGKPFFSDLIIGATS